MLEWHKYRRGGSGLRSILLLPPGRRSERIQKNGHIKVITRPLKKRHTKDGGIND